jgi:hypothetical protein
VRWHWERVDLADADGELQARTHAVRVLLAAQPDCGGTWTGYYDALFSSGTGVSGPTRPMPSRMDALSTATHTVARHWRLSGPRPFGKHLPLNVAGMLTRREWRT